MRNDYIKPQTEILNVTSEVIMDSIAIVHHSGGRNSGTSGFTEDQIM